MTAYEFGLKTELFQHRLRLNGDVFYTDYTNIQVTELGSAANGHPNTVFFTANGGPMGRESSAVISPSRFPNKSATKREYLDRHFWVT